MTEPTASRARVPIVAFVGGTLVAVVLGGVLLAVLFSDTFVTSRVRQDLSDRGVVCDERFALDSNWSFTEVTIAPTRCQLVRLSVAEAVELPEGGTATLSGLRAIDVAIPMLRVHLVAEGTGPPLDLGPMGALGSIASVGSRVTTTAQAASELAAHHPVPTHVAILELVHGSDVAARLSDVAVGGGDPTTFSVARAEFDEIAGPMGTVVTAGLTGITGTATPATCHLEGTLSLGARVPILGEIRHETRLVVEASALDGPSPAFSVSTR